MYMNIYFLIKNWMYYVFFGQSVFVSSFLPVPIFWVNRSDSNNIGNNNNTRPRLVQNDTSHIWLC
jgi:hypothetical protein